MGSAVAGFQDRCVVVTGAAGGIGLELARQLLQGGASVLIVDRDGTALARAARELREHAPRLRQAVLDVADAVAVAAMVVQAAADMGRLDYLFNNAGIAGSQALDVVTLADWRRIVDINLFGVIHGVQAAMPIMRAQGGGHIVNVASAFGLMPAPGRVPYAMSKHAVVGLSESMRLELREWNIHVSVACPGAVATGIWRDNAAPADAMSAAAAAAGILAGVARRRGIIALPARVRRGWLLYRWWPALVERLLRGELRPAAARARR